jgi:hypothetical protein
VVSVWRCYSDRLVQAAEFGTPEPETWQTTWVLAHLAGAYRDCMINLEISGPGSQIMREMKLLKDQLTFGELFEASKELKMLDVLNHMRWFLWHRVDSMGGGYAYNWKTGWDNKMTALNAMRDGYNVQRLIPRSIPLLGEMVTLVQVGDAIQASGRNKDDRVFSTALANYAYEEFIRPEMMVQNRTWAREQQKQMDAAKEEPTPLGETLIMHFFRQQEAERNAMQLKRLIERGDV